MQIIKGVCENPGMVPEGVTAKLHRLTTNLNPSGVSKVPVTGSGHGAADPKGDLRNTCTTLDISAMRPSDQTGPPPDGYTFPPVTHLQKWVVSDSQSI